MVSGILMGLSVVGLGISSYFTAVAYRWLRADELWIPAFCRMGEADVCVDRLRPTGTGLRSAELAPGPDLLPGPAWGDVPRAARPAARPGAVSGGQPADRGPGRLSVVLVALRGPGPCKLCFTSHGINTIIFVLLLSRVSW